MSSSGSSLPRSKRIIAAMAVNCLDTEARSKLVWSSIGVFVARSASPYPRHNKTLPCWITTTAAPGWSLGNVFWRYASTAGTRSASAPSCVWMERLDQNGAEALRIRVKSTRIRIAFQIWGLPTTRGGSGQDVVQDFAMNIGQAHV